MQRRRSGGGASSASAAGRACRATKLYRQMFNTELYLLAIFRINFCPFYFSS